MRRSSGLRLELKDTSAYIPRHEALYIKDDDGPGPFQKKPIGEHGAIPTAAAIANAVYDAIGTQIRDLPITAEKVYSVMLQKKDVTLIGIRCNIASTKNGRHGL